MTEANRIVPLKENEMANIATNSAIAVAGPPPREIDEVTNNGLGNEDIHEDTEEVVEPPTQEVEEQAVPVPVPVPAPAPAPAPAPVPVPMPPVSIPKEIIVEEEIMLKPNAPRLQEETFKDEVNLIPVIRRSRKRVKSTSRKTRKYKRCRKNHRRNIKTHRCNTKCPPGKKKNVTNKRCINKGGKKIGKKVGKK